MLNYVNSYRFKIGADCDPEFANVVLLLPLTGANNSTTFTDVSYYQRSVTRTGDTKIVTTPSKWGNGSAYFDGNGDFLSLSTSNDFNFGTGNFTIEFWYLKAGTAQQYGRIFQTVNGDILTGISIVFNNTQPDNIDCYISYTGSGGWDISALNIGTVSATEWRHFAIVRDSTTMRFFQNGVQQTTTTIGSNPLYYSASQSSIVIGGQTTPSRSANGYIDDLRVTKGTARYTSNFNVPTQAVASVPCYGANLTPGVFTVPIVDGNLSLVIIDAPAITTAPIGNSNLSINTINTPATTTAPIANGNLSINTINTPATTTAPIANGNLSINTINTTSTLTPVFIGV